ncbi:hypothetical protein C8J56DRAFT_373234 [Mycena floridula]|nr:hypothetical protein C8J56DRAFT_373234 [Mycena floridula]
MSITESGPRKILVVGGTSAQGRHVVAELVRNKKYLVTILTRDPSSNEAQSLLTLGNVTIVKGSWDSESSLREALKDQYGVFANLDSLSLTEGQELFWTFRLYDMAFQSGVKHFVYSAIYNRVRQLHYQEKYRVSQMLVKGRISEWLSAQPSTTMGWTILIAPMYTEMLSSLFRPNIDASGTYVFPGLFGNGHIQFVEIEQYGHYTRWTFDNPVKSVGKEIALAAYTATTAGIAEAFHKITGLPAAAVEMPKDKWFETRGPRNLELGISPDSKLPLNLPGGQDDDSRFSHRQIFTSLWNLWESLTADDVKNLPGLELADEIYPGRDKSIEDWMRRTGYTGELKQILKREPQSREENIF